MQEKAPPAELVLHTRAIDELLWKIYVYLVDPQAVIAPGEPRDKPQPKQRG